MSSYKVFDTVPDIVLVIDENQNLFYGNSAATLLLDVTARRLSSGKPLAQYFDIKEGLLDPGTSLSSVDEPTPMREITYTTNNGKDGFWQLTIQAVPDFFYSEDKAKRWLLFMRDVSLEKTLHNKYRGEIDQKEAVIEDLKSARAQLEDYSKNLEKMVEQRTSELRESNSLLGTILDSLGQGIVVFDSQGKILPFYSKVSEQILEKSPVGKSIPELLSLTPSEQGDFKTWMETLFSDMLPFEDLSALGPTVYQHTQGRNIFLNYNPMRNAQGTMTAVVMIATDQTNEVLAKQEAERERNYARMVVQVAKHRQQFRAFALEAKSLLKELQVAVGMDGVLPYEEVTRWLHTIKGGAASFALTELADRTHHLEHDVVEQKNTGEITREFRQKILQDLRTMEAVLLNFLEKNSVLFGGLGESPDRQVEISAPKLSQWHESLRQKQFEAVGREIFEDYLLEPVGRSFSHVDSSLQELAINLGKKLNPLQILNGEIRLLPEAYSELFSTFIHAFRNAVDHGLESAEVRKESGKEEFGNVQLRFEAYSEKNGSDSSPKKWIKIEIVDDGRGIDPEKIKAKLTKLGKADYATGKSDEEIIQAVFLDDFSTAETVSTISGRGVGLSAIKERAERMGGSAKVVSTLGAGSKLVVRVPEITCVQYTQAPNKPSIAPPFTKAS